MFWNGGLTDYFQRLTSFACIDNTGPNMWVVVCLGRQRVVHNETALVIGCRCVPERFDAKPTPIRCVEMICVLASLKIIKSEVGTEDSELVCKKVAHHYEKQE